MHRRSPAPLLLSLLAALALAACGGSGGGSPTEPPAGLSLTLTAVPANITLAGQSQLVVQARDPGGGNVGGLSINLATTLGQLGDPTLVTDAGGRAGTVLRGTGVAGTARVVAQVQGRNISAQAEVRIGLDAAIEVAVEPDTIAGSQSAVVSVRVFAAGGQPAPVTRVTLSTTLGELAADSLLTDALGGARTTLRTDGETGVAVVTASAIGLTATAEARLRPAYELRVTVSPASIPTSGQAAVTVRLVPLDPSAQVRGRLIRLDATRGRLAESSVTTNALGVATTSLAAAGETGVSLVTATMAGAEPGVATVFLGGGGLTVRLTASPTAVPASGGTSTLTVLVAEADGSPVIGAVVDLETSRGGLDATRVTTGGGGLATTVLRGDGTRGQAVVSATIAGTATTDQAIVTFN